MTPRFCSQCGATLVAGAKFCPECGARLDGTAPAAARADGGGWRITSGGLAVFGGLLVAGLGIWAAILSPAPPRPGPGRGGGPGAPAAAAPGQQAAQPLELPAEVTSFMADLAQKAEAAPDDKALWLRLGKVYTRAGQLDPSYNPKALAAFEHVLARDPDDAEALRGKANVFYDRGDHAKAIPLYERYLALAGDDPSARTDLATMYLAAGDSPRAIATYKDVIAKHPTFLQAPYNLAVTYAQLGDKDEALAWFGTARALATDEQVRGQIDQMTARLRGETPPAPAGGGAPVATGGGGAPAAGPAVAGGAPAPPRSPFQADVEKRLRAAPIMGERIVRFDWSGPGAARVVVENFPMEGMPDEIRTRFSERLAVELRSAAEANTPGGDVKLEIADAGAGTVMATVVP